MSTISSRHKRFDCSTVQCFRRSGFTMLEAAITTVLLVGVFGVCCATMVFTQNSMARGEEQIRGHERLRKSKTRLMDELTCAGSATIVGVPPDGAWYQSIQFRVCVDVVNGSPVFSANPISYALVGDELVRTENDVSMTVSNKIMAFWVKRYLNRPENLEVVLVAQNDASDAPQENTGEEQEYGFYDQPPYYADDEYYEGESDPYGGDGPSSGYFFSSSYYGKSSPDAGEYAVARFKVRIRN